MRDLYPRSYRDLDAWSRLAGIKASEGRERLVQFGVLFAICRSTFLRELLVFKGGNALDFVWLPNRSTQDLDFTARAIQVNPDSLRTAFSGALQVAEIELGIQFRVQKVEQMPKGPDRTRATYKVSIGYALPDDRINKLRIDRGEPSRAALPVEVSINEVVCATVGVQFDGADNVLLVATLEDIAAEKLRALLQQVTRNRHRKQDLLDLAVIVHSGRMLEPSKVREFLRLKARARDIEPTTAAFLDEQVWVRAQYDYDQLAKRTRKIFVPYDEAKALVLSLVRSLRLEEA